MLINGMLIIVVNTLQVYESNSCLAKDGYYLVQKIYIKKYIKIEIYLDPS